MVTTVFPLGTCRVHRPLKKRVNKEIIDNIIDSISVIYPKLGFFHSPSEVLQALKALSGQISIAPSYLRLCFRRENPTTTPGNEFLPELLEGAVNQTAVDLQLARFQEADVFLIEISSLTVNFHASSGLYFISNPNLYRDGVAYSDLYHEGFYTKYARELGVEKRELSDHEVTDCFKEISTIVSGRPVIYLGHLNHPDRPSATRKKLNAIIRDAAASAGAHYFDTEPLVKEFGFQIDVNGCEDIHHLSHDGEIALGKKLQSLCLALRKTT